MLMFLECFPWLTTCDLIKLVSHALERAAWRKRLQQMVVDCAIFRSYLLLIAIMLSRAICRCTTRSPVLLRASPSRSIRHQVAPMAFLSNKNEQLCGQAR